MKTQDNWSGFFSVMRISFVRYGLPFNVGHLCNRDSTEVVAASATPREFPAAKSSVKTRELAMAFKSGRLPGASLPSARKGGVQAGFTLIEIAIVMVVITLILAGVLKGQALIDSARVRSMATEVTGIRAAWYSFQDRYRSLPGDFPSSRTQIDDATIPGNGNGRIDGSGERAGVWQQLALAGLIKGNYDGLDSSAGTAQDINCAVNTCPRNPFNGFYKISYGSQAESASAPANEIFTGDGVPVNILAQLDNKLDDGKADAGRFRVHRAFSSSCAVNGEWNVSSGHSNCAAVLRE